jgi:nitrate reductase NapE component
MHILITGMEAVSLQHPSRPAAEPKEAPMPSNYAKIFDRIALGFFTALAMFPVLTVAVGGVFH